MCFASAVGRFIRANIRAARSANQRALTADQFKQSDLTLVNALLLSDDTDAFREPTVQNGVGCADFDLERDANTVPCYASNG